jgi:hypothetical protein
MIMERIQYIFKFLEMRQRFLIPSQFDLVRSLKNYFRAHGNLTPRQIENLEEIKNHIRFDVTAN